MSTALPANSWQRLDQLVDLECASRTYKRSIPGLLDEIQALRNAVIDAPKAIDDFNSLSDSKLIGPDFAQQKAAWITQRITQSRSYCVGSKILRQRAGQVSSPILEQLREFDNSITATSMESTAEKWSNRRQSAASNKIDALGIDPNSRSLYVAKCASVSQVSYTGLAAGPLFLPEHQIIANVRVSSEAINTLLRTNEMLRHRAPGWKVKLLFIVVGDDYSWSFQCHDVTRASQHKDIPFDQEFYLDDYPLFASTRSYSTELAGNPDLFSMVGDPPPFNSIKQALEVCPIYRYTRAMMILFELWEEQRHDRTRLVTMPAHIIQDRLSQKYGFPYTVDARRHDMEDCLRAGRFIARAPWKRNEYAIDHLGVERVLVMIHKYNPMTPCQTEVMVESAWQQRKLWAQ